LFGSFISTSGNFRILSRNISEIFTFFISIPAAVMALATSLSYVFTMALGNNKKTEKVKKK